jgi:hypothetical protein
MPPLSSYNRFACLEVDTPIEPFTCDANSTEVVQTHSHPPTPPIPNQHSQLPAWEHRLPIKYVVAASPGPMSLAVEVEIESTDTMVVRGSPGTLIPDTLAVKPKVSQSTDSMICGL